MTHDEKLVVAQNMIDYGGGFVRRLGELWLHADSDNCARIEATWPEYIEKYTHNFSSRFPANRAKQ